ncbi:MAG: hypothetical protein AAFU72_14525, partial [Pseudomonadota bacterium]
MEGGRGKPRRAGRAAAASGRLDPDEAGVGTARGAAARLIAGVLDQRRLMGGGAVSHLSPPERA